MSNSSRFQNFFTFILIIAIAFILVLSSISFFRELSAISNSRFIVRFGCNKYYTDTYSFIPDGIIFVDSVSGDTIKAYGSYIIEDREDF